jgi:glycosyltransferase involved in cell wall biosynthesis
LEILRLWKQKGTKIVYTRHDEITHYTRNAEESRKLFDIIESETDAVIHLGNYSKEQFLRNKRNPEQKHFVIPHHIYDCLDFARHDVGQAPSFRAKSRNLLNIPPDQFVILAFGSFRAQEEKDLIRNAFKQLAIPDKFLLAPSWNHATRSVSEDGFSEENAFLGDWIVEDEMIPDYFAAADVVFLQRLRTLNSGNLPLGFLFNRTVVGPAIGNMNEYLDNVNNFSFDPEQPDSVVRALEAAYLRSQSPQVNEQYARAHWRTDKISEMHRKVYEEVMSKI